MTMSLVDASVVLPHRMRRNRSHQHLSFYDLPRIVAFFLCFDFDQRRSYFGGGMSDHSIRQHCQHIDWTTTDLIGRSGLYCLEALATIAELPFDCTTAELTIACPLAFRQRTTVGDLAAAAIEFGLSKYQNLIVQRELVHPNLLEELQDCKLAVDWGDDLKIKRGVRAHQPDA